MSRTGIMWAVIALLALGTEPVLADVWSYTDKDNVVHFTNVRPGKADAGKWKRIQKNDPANGKASARRGDCERCDKVPSRDRSPERFTRYDDYIYEAAGLYQLPVALIRAVIKVESDYDPRVVSVFGARGLMQLMPAVVKDMGVHSVHDPRENILGGTRLLRVLANRYDGDLVLTIAAYHAGVGSLAKYGDKVPPYQHTRKYLRMVLDRYYKYADAQRTQY
ncbi:MAG: lytic transglycosylase domain-containing protein [Myxococcales bacterium]|nr:lytic transglycosylase domain-containing protein [Myxococcales bacterium]